MTVNVDTISKRIIGIELEYKVTLSDGHTYLEKQYMDIPKSVDKMTFRTQFKVANI